MTTSTSFDFEDCISKVDIYASPDFDDKLRECDFYFAQLLAETERDRFRWLLSGFLNAAYSFFESTALAAHFRFADADGNTHEDSDGLAILRRHVKVSQSTSDPRFVKTQAKTILTEQLYGLRKKCIHHFPLAIMVTGSSLPEDFHIGDMRDAGIPAVQFCREVLRLIQGIYAELDW